MIATFKNTLIEMFYFHEFDFLKFVSYELIIFCSFRVKIAICLDRLIVELHDVVSLIRHFFLGALHFGIKDFYFFCKILTAKSRVKLKNIIL